MEYPKYHISNKSLILGSTPFPRRISPARAVKDSSQNRQLGDEDSSQKTTQCNTETYYCFQDIEDCIEKRSVLGSG